MTATGHPSTRRTWPQRLVIAAAVVVAVASFTSAAALATGHWLLSQRQLVVIDDSGLALPDATGVTINDDDTSSGDAPVLPDAPEPAAIVIDGLAEPEAANFLLVGTDNNACVDPDSPYAPFILGREGFGERADVIMMWRINPETGAAAALSMQRDLYVRLDGGRQGRINQAFDPADPNRLINTIRNNFGIDTDHYVQIDFCAFKTLVDAVGGVGLPLTYPLRDRGTGLSIGATGCVNLNGDDALAYVRSRYLEYENPAGSGTWIIDPTSDYGRIRRQQDFLRRTLAKTVAGGLSQPSVAAALIESNREYVVTDNDLSITAMLEFANVLRRIDIGSIGSYQITATGRTVAGKAVLIPLLRGNEMEDILDIFQGDATIEGSPIRLSEIDATTTTTPTAAPDTTQPTTSDTTSTTTEPGTTATEPEAPESTVSDATTVDTTDSSLPAPAGEAIVTGRLPRQDDPPTDVATPESNTIGWVPDGSIMCD